MTVKIKTNIGKFQYAISSEEHLLLLNVGIAMLRIQHFENLLATVLGSMDETAKKLTLENADEVLEKFQKESLGRLNKLIREKVNGKDLHENLGKVRDCRNFIAHHALKNYGSMNAEEMVRLSLQIDSITELIDDVQDFLIKELSAQDVMHISEVYIEFDENGELKDLS